jgi:two-component system cell cycle sensor histidine kinase/response regulator CckA
VPDDLWPIECDAAELELALMNLCVNARDAMPAGGLVRVHACNMPRGAAPDDPAASGNRVGGLTAGLDEAPLGDYVRISVTDTGTGIPPDVLAKVFEPFFTTKEIGKGTGLGLDIVWRIVVTRHNGSVTLESEPGHTRFRVVLPVRGPGERGA